MAKAKCGYCNKEIIDKTNCTKKGSRWYHNECLDKSKSDRQLLLDYIQKIYLDNGYDKRNINWAVITKQLKNVLDENTDFKYSGIKYCLWYMIEVCKEDLFLHMNGSILDLVPYKYVESKEFYKQSIALKKSAKQVVFNTDVNVVTTNYKPQNKYMKDLTFD